MGETITTGWRTFGDYERKVDWTEGYDCRTTCEHGRCPDHGISSDKLDFCIRPRSGPTAATRLSASMNTTHRRVVFHDLPTIDGRLVTTHVVHPTDEEQARLASGEACDLLPLGTCYGYGMSALQAVEMIGDFERAAFAAVQRDSVNVLLDFAIVLNTGLWERLRAWHDECATEAATAASTLPRRCPACDGKGLVPADAADAVRRTSEVGQALALAKSMILSGESMSPTAEEMFKNAFAMLTQYTSDDTNDVDFLVQQSVEVNKALASCHVVSGVQGVQALRQHLDDALEALIWCSGSPDFAPGGIAHAGWQKGPAKTIERLLSVTGRSKT